MMFKAWVFIEHERDQVSTFFSYPVICPCLMHIPMVCIVGKSLGNQFVFAEQLDEIHDCPSVLADGNWAQVASAAAVLCSCCISKAAALANLFPAASSLVH